MTQEAYEQVLEMLSPMVEYTGGNDIYQKWVILENNNDPSLLILCLETNGWHSTITDSPHTYTGLYLTGVDKGDVGCYCKGYFKKSDIPLSRFKNFLTPYKNVIEHQYGVGRVLDWYWK